MNFGYLIVVSTSETADYLKLAYALALSIKNTQKPGYDKVALVIDNKKAVDDLNSPWVFDEVIEWKQETFWDGRSWMDKLSPWEYTVCLDADILFLRDYSHWIDYFISNCELYVANKSYTYRGEIVTNDFYRKTFVKNSLPNLYSFFTFFKKDSGLATEFFTLGRYILKNPLEFSNTFLSNYKPKIIGTDEAFALSAKILDIADIIAYPLDFPKVIHLKGQIQNWPWPADVVTNHVGFYFNKLGNLKIGNFQQYDIVHYVEKDLIADEALSILEEIAWKKP
jgi:hypothetical protein